MATEAPDDAPDLTGASPSDGAPESAPPSAPQRPAAAQPSDSRLSPPGRSQIRRRVRFLRRLRELQLRDIGGFLLECYRLGRPRPDLVEAKVEEALRTDRELRALQGTLEQGRAGDEVRQPGIGGSCAACGTVHGSGDRFCSWCGNRL